MLSIIKECAKGTCREVQRVVQKNYRERAQKWQGYGSLKIDSR